MANLVQPHGGLRGIFWFRDHRSHTGRAPDIAGDSFSIILLIEYADGGLGLDTTSPNRLVSDPEAESELTNPSSTSYVCASLKEAMWHNDLPEFIPLWFDSHGPVDIDALLARVEELEDEARPPEDKRAVVHDEETI